MIKNNKGFTLVEVIAVVVILGILSVMAAPQVFRLVDESRKKVYVQEANRLIALAQYTMNANSNKIEKPSNGNAIVFSMAYLDPKSSRKKEYAPKGGEYLMNHSFVVVKREDDIDENGIINAKIKYKYAVMLVEKTGKGDYVGVKLSKEEDLQTKNSISYVTAFKASDLLYVCNKDNINDSNMLNKNKINNNLSNWLIGKLDNNYYCGS